MGLGTVLGSGKQNHHIPCLHGVYCPWKRGHEGISIQVNILSHVLTGLMKEDYSQFYRLCL